MDFIELLKVALLAVFQGVAEFLPISSSGHLQVLQYLLHTNPESNLFMNVVLHAGTLVAILVFYFGTLWQILAERKFKLILAVIIGTIPAGIVGVSIKKTGLDELIFEPLWIPAIGFIITGTLLLFCLRKRSDEEEEQAVPLDSITLKQALIIGVAQSIAIMPGISRSGSTIATAMKMKLKATDCAKFSFLLAIPAIAGAVLLETVDCLKDSTVFESVSIVSTLVGFVVSGVVGYFSLKLLVGMLNKGKLQWFAWYVYAASLFTFILYITSLVKKG